MCRIHRFGLVILATVLLAACGGSNAPQPNAAAAPPPAPDPTKFSPDSRPKWTNLEPDAKDGTLFFVGISNPYATERGARDDAMRNATQRVVDYLGTSALSKFEQATTSFGLSSSVVDPTQATRAFQQQISGNVARQLKAAEWYVEREQSNTGRGFVAFVRSTIPVASINDAFQKTAQQNMQDAQKRARDAADDQAKQQADKAAQFWADMSKQGLIPGNQ
jgi:hypothetical protein